MAMLGELTAPIGGGVLLIGDDGPHDDGLGDDGPHPMLGVGPAQLVLSVVNGYEAGTRIRVSSAPPADPAGPVIFDGPVRVGTGRLRVGDTVDEAVLVFPVPPGDVRVRLHINEQPDEMQPPDRVDIILG